ncbi:DNA binding protein [Staphylococcus phage Alsa_3]|nr:DNA binding protein [Staphylococcus phage Alsa_3]
MFLELNNEHKELVNKRKNKEKEYDTKLDKFVCESYINGESNVSIIKKAKISHGKLYSILRKYSVPEKTNTHTRIHKRIKHITDNPERLKELISDYESGIHSVEYLKFKYKLHKNGLYTILDMFDVKRKRGN